jgi:hypothetical protein
VAWVVDHGHGPAAQSVATSVAIVGERPAGRSLAVSGAEQSGQPPRSRLGLLADADTPAEERPMTAHLTSTNLANRDALG